jgi:ubiquinone/menaquinone biosynthesis C-methylase UbiE
MSRRFVDYDRIAETYDQRYSLNRLDGVAKALEERLSQTEAETILDVGCGTGRWLAELAPSASLAVGLDRSLGMLLRVPVENGREDLVCGSGDAIPLADSSIDFVTCVNAIHHLEAPSSFILDAVRLLRPLGALAVVGLDPHPERDRWYLYDYFPEARELDLRRYPATEQLTEWMRASGLENIETAVVERIQRRYVGGEILEDYFLQRKASSQLAILSDEAWAQGLQRIRRSIQKGEQEGAPPIFEVDLALVMVCGWKPSPKT